MKLLGLGARLEKCKNESLVLSIRLVHEDQRSRATKQSLSGMRSISSSSTEAVDLKASRIFRAEVTSVYVEVR